MRHSHSRALIGLLASALLLAACSAGQQAPSAGSDFNAKDYFSGKTIRVVTSSSPGGTTDAKARAIAANLGRFIPGHPRLKVTNQTPHVAGLNYIWNSPNDGTVMAVESSSPLEFELYQAAQWNSARFRYLGSLDTQCRDILFMRGDLPYKNIRDVKEANSPKLTTIGEAPNPASIPPMLLGQMLIAKYLDLPFRLKTVAEVDSAAQFLGLERGDINVVRQDYCQLSKTHPQWVKSDYLIPLLDITPTPPSKQGKKLMRDKLGEDVPYVSKPLSKPEMREWRGVVATRRAGGNPVFLPPGTPDNVTNALREAWSEASKDPEYRKAMQKAYGSSHLKLRSPKYYTQLTQKNRKRLYQQRDQIDSLTKRMFNRYTR